LDNGTHKAGTPNFCAFYPEVNKRLYQENKLSLLCDFIVIISNFTMYMTTT